MLEKLKERVERFAEKNGLKVDWENYKNVVKAGGYCPCRVEKHPCPCKYAKKEIAVLGHCMCLLFSKA